MTRSRRAIVARAVAVAGFQVAASERGIGWNSAASAVRDRGANARQRECPLLPHARHRWESFHRVRRIGEQRNQDTLRTSPPAQQSSGGYAVSGRYLPAPDATSRGAARVAWLLARAFRADHARWRHDCRWLAGTDHWRYTYHRVGCSPHPGSLRSPPLSRVAGEGWRGP